MHKCTLVYTPISARSCVCVCAFVCACVCARAVYGRECVCRHYVQVQVNGCRFVRLKRLFGTLPPSEKNSIKNPMNACRRLF